MNEKDYTANILGYMLRKEDSICVWFINFQQTAAEENVRYGNLLYMNVVHVFAISVQVLVGQHILRRYGI